MKCPNCGTESSGPFCSGCGTRIDEGQSTPQAASPAKKKPSKALGCLTALIVFVVVIALLASLGGDDSSTSTTSTGGKTNSTTTESVEQKKSALEVLEHSVKNDAYTRYIVGTVKNNSSREYSYVQVEINLYDDEGNQVGSTMDNTNNLEPGGTWKFKAIVLEDSATEYKIKDVSGF
jgi:uncharacterized membrane protein